MAKDKAPLGTNSLDEDVQIPEKPKKRTGGDIGIAQLVMIIGGTLFAIVLVVFGLYWFLIRPDIIGGNGSNADSTKQKEVELSDAEKARIAQQQEIRKYEEMDALGDQSNVLFNQTSDIITNTSGLDWFVVVQLGLEYRISDQLAEKNGEGAGAALDPRLESEIRAYVTKYFGMRTMDQISASRDSLEMIFKTHLKPIFLKHQMFLRRVSLPKFVTQRS